MSRAKPIVRSGTQDEPLPSCSERTYANRRNGVPAIAKTSTFCCVLETYFQSTLAIS